MAGETLYPDGTPVPTEKVGEAIAKGEARWRAGEMVPFIAPDGSGYSIPAEQAQKQVEAGWTPVDPATFEQLKSRKTPASVAEVLGSYALGAADFPSLGTASSLVPEETKRRLEVAAPTAAQLGQVTGLALTLGAGGAGKGGLSALDVALPGRAVARGAGAAGEFVASKLPSVAGSIGRSAVSAGVAGGLEGGAYAAGQELARVAQGDEDFNAEIFASQVGRGAITGAAFGGAVGGGVAAAGWGLGKSFGGVRGAYDELAAAARRDVSPTAPGNRLSRSQAEAAKAAGISRGDFAREGIRKADVMLRDMLDEGVIPKGGALNAALKGGIDDVAEAHTRRLKALGKEYDNVYPAVDQSLKALSPEGQAFAALKQNVIAPASDFIGELRKQGKPYESIAAKLDDWLDAVDRAPNVEKMHNIISDIQREARGVNVEKLTGDNLNAFADVLKNKGLRPAIASVDPALATKLEKLDQLYGAYAAYNPKVVEAAAKAQATKSPVSPFDFAAIATGVATGNPQLALFGVGKIGAKLANESTRIAAAKARFFEGANTAVTKERVGLYTSITDAAKKHAAKLPVAAGRTAAALERTEFKDAAKDPLELTTNPVAATAKLQTQLAPVAAADAPRAAKIAELRTSDLQWLATKLGEWTNESRQPWEIPGKGAPPLPASAVASFLRASEAAKDPIGELQKNLKTATAVSPELAEFIRERRPSTRAAIEREFDRETAELAEKGKVMSYGARMTATVVTGKPYDATHKPDAILFYAKSWGSSGVPQPALPNPGEGSGRRPTKAARQRLGRFRTTAEDVMNSEVE